MFRDPYQGFDNFDRAVVGVMFLSVCTIIFLTTMHLERKMVALTNQIILERQDEQAEEEYKY